ncbi:hypothetical protein GWK47_026297 [Chionoecetes opilio]|uniref:Uncharacterized protein n=1 Tax=Chionoecetes opilio TaxID=41210 RepID=A0A8J8WDT8_CHIOP|nr:hypothetical protein GWK47_026297 [Chionoecetes opilio]
MAQHADQVALLCDASEESGGTPTRGRDFVPLAALTVVFVGLLGLMVLVSPGREHLGMSERETLQPVEIIDTHAVFVAGDSSSLPGVKQAALTRLVAPPDPKSHASEVLQEISDLPFQVKSTDENDDLLEDSDEVKGLLKNIGEDPTDPNAIAFLLPLRGHVGDLGLRFGRSLKKVMEESMESAGNHSQFIPSTILVRDTQSDPEVTRSLSEHFYDVHGITRYFGLLTDEEALTVALWARARAPGSRFVSPTATSPYLEKARNVATVQPSGNMLAAAVADFLLTVQAPQPLVVVRASLHTDAMLSLLRSSGIRPAKVLHYYHMNNMSEFAAVTLVLSST